MKKNIKHPTIIIPAFRRANSLKRLLESIRKADYPEHKVNIIISLDGGHSHDVLVEAEKFKESFTQANIEIHRREENVGLREHILWCGDKTKYYDSVIILEDDLIVSRDFYNYAIAAEGFFSTDESICGISLYSQRFNEYTNLPFEPLQNQHENYFMMIACSWGQLWTRNQWENFRSWYDGFDKNSISNIIELPPYVRSWPESSWKKYFSAYMATTKKYFVYPYNSYTSNCADPGGHHSKLGLNLLQVPLPSRKHRKQKFSFIALSQCQEKYDTYMEPNSIIAEEGLGIPCNEIEIDLYGSKPIELLIKKKYCLTSKSSSKPIQKISLKLKPIEQNIISNSISNRGDVLLTLTKHINKDNFFSERKRHLVLANYYSYFGISSKSFIAMSIANRIRSIV